MCDNPIAQAMKNMEEEAVRLAESLGCGWGYAATPGKVAPLIQMPCVHMTIAEAQKIEARLKEHAT